MPKDIFSLSHWTGDSCFAETRWEKAIALIIRRLTIVFNNSLVSREAERLLSTL